MGHARELIGVRSARAKCESTSLKGIIPHIQSDSTNTGVRSYGMAHQGIEFIIIHRSQHRTSPHVSSLVLVTQSGGYPPPTDVRHKKQLTWDNLVQLYSLSEDTSKRPSSDPFVVSGKPTASG